MRVEGGVAGNVVPDRVEIDLGHRFAPDRTPEQAEASVRELLEPFLEPGDTIELVDMSPAAPPAVDHPCIAALIERTDSGCAPSWAGPTSHGSPHGGFRRSTWARATPPWRTPPRSGSNADSLERAHRAFDDLLRRGP